MSVAVFIEESLSITEPDQLFARYLKSLRAYGVDRVVYCALRNTPDEKMNAPSIYDSYPDDWINHYIENDYVNLDPTRLHGLGTANAFTWDQMGKIRNLNPQQNEVMNLGSDAGLKDGLSVPFHGPMGEVYGVGMASSERNPDVANHLLDIQILSTQFHVLFSALHNAQDNSAPKPMLSKREREVLKWIAVGKSNWSIGEILSISDHTVDFHARNILRKLGADTRITAVVKALYLGEIEL